MYYHRIDETNKEFRYAVGHYDPQGNFITVVRFKYEQDASNRVQRLNSNTTIVKEKSSSRGWTMDF